VYKGGGIEAEPEVAALLAKLKPLFPNRDDGHVHSKGTSNTHNKSKSRDTASETGAGAAAGARSRSRDHHNVDRAEVDIAHNSDDSINVYRRGSDNRNRSGHGSDRTTPDTGASAQPWRRTDVKFTSPRSANAAV
jgi:hypothetical protein